MKIAVIQTAFPGDVILASALFEALKSIYPAASISAVVRPESAPLIEHNPHVDDVFTYDKYGAEKGVWGISLLSRMLKGHDQAIIIQRHLRSAMIAFFAGIPERIGFDNSSAKLLYTKRIRYRGDIHEVRRCLSLIGSEDSHFKPRIYIDDATDQKARDLLESHGIDGDFAVVAPGSVWPTKRYPYYPGLIHLIGEKLGLPVVLLGGKDDLSESFSLEQACKTPPVNLVGSTGLLESTAVISKAKIVFANDSAPSHIAAAVDTPVVAIFGPTVREFGFAPYSEKSAVVDIGDLYCRPCGTHGAKKCPQRHFRCMLELQPSRIVEAALSLLSG